jgi:dTDP-glucose 4,6-dehydratase
LRKTVDWYLANGPWLADVQSSEYRRWIDLHYAAA